MKTTLILLVTAGLVGCAHAEKKAEAPVPVSTGRSAPAPVPPADSQRLYGPTGSIVSQDKAQVVIDNFRGAYDKLGKPRFLVYVNRELVNENAGLKLTGRQERVESTQGSQNSSFETDPNAPKPAESTAQTQVNVAVGGNVGNGTNQLPGKGASETRNSKVTAENTYSGGDIAAPTLADKQTVREVERLFGRPLRAAGVALADQRVASSLIADRPLDHFTSPANEAGRKDREALAKIADVVLEVLVSSRTINVAEVSGDRAAEVPDLQVTAIRLSDSAIIGQASASDILGKDRDAGRIVRSYDVREITEATALALMEDIAQSTR